MPRFPCWQSPQRTEAGENNDEAEEVESKSGEPVTVKAEMALDKVKQPGVINSCCNTQARPDFSSTKTKSHSVTKSLAFVSEAKSD